MAILDYMIEPLKGQEGKVATAEPTVIRTGLNATANNIPNGRVLVQGAKNSEVTLPSGTAKSPIGVSVANTMTENVMVGGNSILTNAPKRSLNRLVKGAVWMVFEQDANAGDPVFFRHAANSTPGTYDAIGRLRKDADGTNATALPQARLETAVKAGDVAEVVFNFT